MRPPIEPLGRPRAFPDCPGLNGITPPMVTALPPTLGQEVNISSVLSGAECAGWWGEESVTDRAVRITRDNGPSAVLSGIAAYGSIAAPPPPCGQAILTGSRTAGTPIRATVSPRRAPAAERSARCGAGARRERKRQWRGPEHSYPRRPRRLARRQRAGQARDENGKGNGGKWALACVSTVAAVPCGSTKLRWCDGRRNVTNQPEPGFPAIGRICWFGCFSKSYS